MRRWTPAIAVAIAACIALGTVTSSALAASKLAHGWWWRPQTGLLGATVPPPAVPEDGLAVEAAPDGPNAVAAVRYDLEADESKPALVLTVADSQGDVAIKACTATEFWQEAQAGPWDQAPPTDCAKGVDGKASADGKTWRWELKPLLRKRRLDVVLVPAPGAGRVTFNKPDDGSLKTQRPQPAQEEFDPPPVSDLAPPPQTAPEPPPAEDPPPPPPPAPPANDGGSFPSAGSTGTGGGSPGTSQAPAITTPGTADAPADDIAAPLTAAEAPPAAAAAAPADAPAATVPATSNSSTTIGAIIAAMATVLALGLWHQDSSFGRGAAPVGQRAAGAQQVGGIGRFTRPRSGAPRPLL